MRSSDDGRRITIPDTFIAKTAARLKYLGWDTGEFVVPWRSEEWWIVVAMSRGTHREITAGGPTRREAWQALRWKAAQVGVAIDAGEGPHAEDG